MNTNTLVENNHQENISVDIDLLDSIKNFMDDLSNITTTKNFEDYHTIVNHIDKTKVKSYTKLINGFINFFKINTEALECGNFNGLNDPNIFYTTDNGSFSFNLQEIYENAEEGEQDAIKDHLNHIWNIINNTDKSPEEKYIDKIFRDLKSRFSPNLTREEQMMIAKDLFNDFQTQHLDISIVVKVACKKARELLLLNGAENSSQTLVLIDAVEEIDINNFNMIEFMALVGKVGTLFADGENNPLSGLLTSVFEGGINPPPPLAIDQLKLDDEDDHE
ncbi:hypothetical protein IIV22_086R [Invertebrate iridescent virus 22]|uniref:Uncharacterized protein n=1 Tax=Invertebrate iridescent virus 22 TaxID=345198 RepID=S6DA69_9VIRU|nr:hypothetical protein IIV22_086R [Invertebrate iridescent virus 22]CCV01763.1 hypothetical protein IIV22_086R [Invertebrate iridescent virus 22]